MHVTEAVLTAVLALVDQRQLRRRVCDVDARPARQGRRIAHEATKEGPEEILRGRGVPSRADVPAGEQQTGRSESAEHEKQGQRLRSRLREIT